MTVQRVAPVTSQASVRRRAMRAARRASMSTLIAVPQPAEPGAGRDQDRGEHQEQAGRDHRDGEVAHVAGAHEHAVEHEHDRVHRLQHGHEQQQERGQLHDLRVVGERVRQHLPQRQQRHPDQHPEHQPELDHPPGRGPRGHRVAGPEQPADQGLRGDRDRVQGEREGVPQLERDLVRADLGRAEPGRDRGRRGQRQPQRRRSGPAGRAPTRASRPTARPTGRSPTRSAPACRPRPSR